MKLLISFLFVSSILFAQDDEFTLSGYIFDNETNKPIELITVTNITNKKGFYTDNKGYFAVLSSVGDTLILSSIEYQDDTLIVKSNEILNIKMNPSVVVLNEIKITEGESTTQIGYLKAHNKPRYGISAQTAGYEVASLVKSEEHQFKTIKKVRVAKQSKGHGRIRLHLYTVGVNGEPNKELLTSNVVIDGANFKKELVFDIEKYNISLPSKGIYVSIEWIDGILNGEGDGPIALKGAAEVSENAMYVRNVFRGFKWKTRPRLKNNICVSLEM